MYAEMVMRGPTAMAPYFGAQQNSCNIRYTQIFAQVEKCIMKLGARTDWTGFSATFTERILLSSESCAEAVVYP
jgi:hypothetical protein